MTLSTGTGEEFHYPIESLGLALTDVYKDGNLLFIYFAGERLGPGTQVSLGLDQARQCQNWTLSIPARFADNYLEFSDESWADLLETIESGLGCGYLVVGWELELADDGECDSSLQTMLHSDQLSEILVAISRGPMGVEEKSGKSGTQLSPSLWMLRNGGCHGGPTQ